MELKVITREEEIRELFKEFDKRYDEAYGKTTLIGVNTSQGFEVCRNACGEYRKENSNCLLIKPGNGLCAKSLLRVKQDKDNQYKIFQFGTK
jgi:hypothetical protein